MGKLAKFVPVISGSMPVRRPTRYRIPLLYGIALAVLLFLLQWFKLRFIIIDHYFEIYVGAIAITFTTLGIWLALKLAKPKVQTVIVEKEITRNGAFVFNETAAAHLGLSGREVEVLGLMAEGLSNQEIASRLFVSLNTIKTHSSRLFDKMEVKRRTQAVDKAKKLGIIP
ncbi:response regulator transcription factor [Parapedobacter koreensis]|uniref:Regulatory protein, luxR family n=1 Tax=Parapedobacter koreensis TaxID=332977 RepID=A0A1H7K026_9SPHI|nr:LuxR C-terminal-related transcriptional regulator [Parapedobacter koreensis]SEK80122.1 regulatory protein, luxR family [Parapedobacter koreensis]